METRNLGKIMVLLFSVPVSLFIGAWVLTNPTGAISGLSKLATIVIAFVSLVNPRLGLYLFLPQAIYSDEIKRLAVYFGSVSFTTVYEVLLGPIITLLCLNLGYVVNVIFGRAVIAKGWVIFYGVILLACGIVFITADGGIPARAQLVLNSALYITLLPLMAAFLKSRKEVNGFLILMAWIALPSAVWGIHQYYNGLSALEIAYARTGLSATHYGQVLSPNPRPFGFFGSNSGYGSVGILGVLGILYFSTGRHRGVLGLFLVVLYVWAIFASKQRTVLLTVPLVYIVAWCFRSKILTKVFYLAAVLLFGLGITFSDYLLNTGLDKINSAIASNTSWGKEVLTVNTFSDRLRGWSRLKKASSYSPFGMRLQSASYKGKTDVGAASYSHDVINSILIKTGVAGLLVVIVLFAFVISKCHSMLYTVQDRVMRFEASVLFAVVFMIVGLSFTAGSILATTPINLLIWAVAGAYVVICANAGATALPAVDLPVQTLSNPSNVRRPQLQG
jgi:O-Antigen ligase